MLIFTFKKKKQKCISCLLIDLHRMASVKTRENFEKN